MRKTHFEIPSTGIRRVLQFVVSVLCRNLSFALVEVCTVDWESILAIVRFIDNPEKCPEWCPGFGADHPSGGHAAHFCDTRFDAGKAKLFVGIVGVELAQHVLVTVGRFQGKSIGSMDFEDWFDQLHICGRISNLIPRN